MSVSRVCCEPAGIFLGRRGIPAWKVLPVSSIFWLVEGRRISSAAPLISNDAYEPICCWEVRISSRLQLIGESRAFFLMGVLIPEFLAIYTSDLEMFI
mmetsp:Transcript_32379/g.49547  ORF Transcript_32379/g.49547 Transcript_32379/m.49547 type:complete len:98 (+) Transcript_32379:266-559(+)